MVNPILAGSIALMISTGAGVLVAPKAAAYLDADAHAGDWCGDADASMHAHARTRRVDAEAGGRARAAQWLCGDEDEHDVKPHAEAGDDEECEEHGRKHRAHATARPRLEARVSVEAEI